MWKLYFIEVFQDNPGFDIIIGNPPYIGESGNRTKFQEVRNSSSLKKFYKGKIDYYYFFFHLALNLLKNNGVLNFITTSYFTTSTAGNILRKDLKTRGSFLELIDFDELKIFKSAQGQHNMISTVIKDTENYSCRIIQTLRKGLNLQDELKNILYNKDVETSYKLTTSDKIFEGKNDYIRLSENVDTNSDLQNLILKKLVLTQKDLIIILISNKVLLVVAIKLLKHHWICIKMIIRTKFNWMMVFLFLI